MKIIASVIFSLTIHLCIGQTSILSEKFLSDMADKYAEQDLNDETQYYRMLLPSRRTATYVKAIALKAKATHSTRNSRFVERNQTIGFYAFEYANKKDCKISVDSILKCFPNYCLQIERQKPMEGQLTPSVYVINEKNIYCIETFCEDVNEQWDVFIKNFVAEFASNNSNIILTGCGKLEWTTKEKMTH